MSTSPKSIIITAIAQKVREARQESGLSQNELAQRVGLTRTRINQIEQGRTRTIKPENIQKIATALDKPELYFYLGVTHTLDSLPESVKGVMSKLAILPFPQQEKLGRIMAEIVKWYEKEIGVEGSGR
jgi:transcriptional regulator with XRE-family HTH domain